MGGSSPHCSGARDDSAAAAAARTPFVVPPTGRSDLRYASKRAASRSGGISQLVLGPRGQQAQKANRKECGKTVAYRIVICAVLLWLVFQMALLLQSLVVKHSEIDLAVTMPWSDRLQQMPQSLINNSLASKLRGRVIPVQTVKSWPTLRTPRLALICPHVEMGPDAVFFVTLARGLLLLGYRLELYTLKDGSLHALWNNLNVPVNLLDVQNAAVDWSMFDGVLAVSLYSRFAFTSLLVDPFRLIPLIWIIQDNKSVKYLDDIVGQTRTTWKRSFERANVVVFPNDALPHTCARYDAGNFRVIPGSPLDVWEAEEYMNTYSRQATRSRYGLGGRDLAIAIASSSSSGIWKAHAMIMHAIAGLASTDPGYRVKLFVLGYGSYGNYSIALEAMASQLGLPNTSIYHVGDEDMNAALWAADVVGYVSVSEEKLFSPVIVRAMAFGQLVLAPATSVVQKYIIEGVNGFLYPKDDYDALWARFLRLWRSGAVKRITSAAKMSARNLLASEAISEYAEVLQSKLEFPSEVSIPDLTRLPELNWEWNLLDRQTEADKPQRGSGDFKGGDKNVSLESDNKDYEHVLENEVSEENVLRLIDDAEKAEDEELDERKEQVQATFEDVNKGVKRAEREKFEFHERDDGELERTGQALCIYEPYYGSGAWPFLHQYSPLYRGLSLSPKGRRPRVDDVDAPARLVLLNDTYYRQNLCEFGAFLAIANRIDRVHKNSWIGFQPWSAAARKVALSKEAEASLVEGVRLARHGDAVYYWNKADSASDNFWLACDARNAGACRTTFLETFKAMYGVGDVALELPYMPAGAWAGMHCWAMSTPSFMEFVMFSRMFLDALDARLYVEHHGSGKCPLASTKSESQHCYCRLLEVLVNVWAYHSGRRLVYVDPQTGLTMEQNPVESRRGLMKTKWFSFAVLKGMDEDMAARADEEHPVHRWLWPHTGEVFWQGILEKERQERYSLKMERKRRNKERLARMRSRYKQKSLGRYVKPPPDEEQASNTTTTITAAAALD